MRELTTGDQVITRREYVVPPGEYKSIGTIKMISDVTGDVTVEFPQKIMVGEKGYTLKCSKSAIISIEDVIEGYYSMTASDNYKFCIGQNVWLKDTCKSKYSDTFGDEKDKYSPVGTVIDIVYGLYIVQFINAIDLKYLNIEIEEDDLDSTLLWFFDLDKSDSKSDSAEIERDEENYNSYPVCCSDKIEVGDVVIPFDLYGCNIILDKFEAMLKSKDIDPKDKEIGGNGIVVEAYTPAYNPNVETEPRRLLDIKFNIHDESSGKVIGTVTLTDIPEAKVCHIPVAFENENARARYVNYEYDYYNSIVDEMSKVITPYNRDKEPILKVGDMVSFADNRAYAWISNDICITDPYRFAFFGRVVDIIESENYSDMIIAKFRVANEDVDSPDESNYLDVLTQASNLISYADIDASDDAIKYNWCERAEEYKKCLEAVIAQESNPNNETASK